MSFSQPSGSPVGAGDAPSDVVSGDFDGDGDLDLAAANFDSDNVTILLGNGTGGFSQASGSPITVDDGPDNLLIGDFNNDNDLDLAVANIHADNVSILLGDGAGGFSQALNSPFAVGDAPRSMTVGDFDNDGDLDLATGNSNISTATILLGNGAGSFSEAVGSPITVGAGVLGITAGDFDLDGNLDLATANPGTDDVTILLGNGAGGFSEATGSPVAAGDLAAIIRTADLDLDGNRDLVVVNASDDNVTILLGDGDAGFSQPSGSPVFVGSQPAEVAIGDLDLDGNLDLTVTRFGTDNAVILLGDGSGGFTEALNSPITVGDGAAGIAMGDFDSDGRQDIAVAAFNTDNIAILLSGCEMNGPIVTSDPVDLTECAGYPQSFTASATGATSVQWQKSTNGGTSWTDIAGATNKTYTFVVMFADSNAHFRAIFSDGSAYDTTNPATLTVYPPPTMSMSLSPSTISANNTMRTITADISVFDGCSPRVTLDSITATENGLPVSLAGEVANASFGSNDRSFDLRARSTTSGHSRVYTVHYSLIDGPFSQSHTAQVIVLAGGGFYTGPAGGISISSPTPNPLTTSTSFTITTSSACWTRLSVYNLRGIWITDIFASQMINGAYPVTWNGTTAGGQPLPNGTYILQAKGCGSAATAAIAINR